LRFCRASALGIYEAHALAQWEPCAYHGQAARFANVYGDAVGLLSLGAFLPFDLELHPGNDTPVGAQFLPSLFKSFTFGDTYGVYSGFGGHACLAACGFVTWPGYSKRQVIARNCPSQ
jgi:hypothetical protein